MSALGLLLDPLLSLLYPPRCLVCRTLGPPSGLCDRCARRIAPIPPPFCGRCGQPAAAEADCRHCRRRVPAFDRARSMGVHDGVLRAAIHRLKYRDRPQLAEPLGALLAEFARAQSPALQDLRFDGLLPVPMHPVRRRLRGYNQSERLARAVGQALGLPVNTRSLARTRNTRPQVGLTGDARQTNLRDVFAVSHPEEIAGKAWLLIDDVTTTGSTLHECAATLKAAGAKAVYALTLAAG